MYQYYFVFCFFFWWNYNEKPKGKRTKNTVSVRRFSSTKKYWVFVSKTEKQLVMPLFTACLLLCLATTWLPNVDVARARVCVCNIRVACIFSARTHQKIHMGVCECVCVYVLQVYESWHHSLFTNRSFMLCERTTHVLFYICFLSFMLRMKLYRILSCLDTWLNTFVCTYCSLIQFTNTSVDRNA